MNEQKSAIVNALPPVGEVPYATLQTTLAAAGKTDALEVFHAMRRKGEVKVSLKTVDGVTTLFVSRA